MLTVACVTSIFDTPNWTLNNVLLKENSKYTFSQQIDRSNNLRHLNLTIINLDDSDTGDYRCTLYSKPFHRIDVLSKHSKRDSSVNEILFKENEVVTLSCNIVSGDTTMFNIKWSKNGVPVTESARIINYGTRLVIKSAQSKDSGLYECIVDVHNLPTSVNFGTKMYLREHTDIVKVAPFPYAIFKPLFTELRIECQVTGSPMPSIKWLIGNKEVNEKVEIDNNIRLQMNAIGHNNAVLYMTNFTKENENVYTCEANNNVTSASSSFRLLVDDAGITTTANGEGFQELFVGTVVKMQCNGTGQEKVTRWLKDGNEISEKSSNNFEIDNKTNSLRIKQARRKEDEGNYTCDFGVSNSSIRLIAKPLIDKLMPVGHTKDGKSVNIVEGSTLTLECIANSSAALTFQWYTIPDTTDDNKGRLRVRGNVTNYEYRSVLTIESTTLEDRALYGCKAENSVGEVQFEILVRVKDKWMALWPFLGIVGEVIILCTIIFIYEKRRQKPDFDDSSNDNANENKSPVASGTSKGQEIRQRK